jgi:hypothetical protein
MMRGLLTETQDCFVSVDDRVFRTHNPAEMESDDYVARQIPCILQFSNLMEPRLPAVFKWGYGNYPPLKFHCV